MRKRRWMWMLAGLVALMMVAAACNGDDDENGAAATPSPEEEAPEFETIEEGVLTVGSDIPFEPFEFREGGEEMGFDVDLITEVASRLDLEVEFVDTAFDTIFTQLAGGQFDAVASATTITEEREQQVNFSVPYFRDEQVLTVNTAETPDIQSTDDLGEGDMVAVQTGTTGEEWARDNLEDQGVEIRSFPEAPDTYTAAEAGNVQGVIFDFFASLQETQARENLEIVENLETGEMYGFPINPQNEELLEAFDTALQEVIDDGTYEEIYQEWFPDNEEGSILTE